MLVIFRVFVVKENLVKQLNLKKMEKIYIHVFRLDFQYYSNIEKHQNLKKIEKSLALHSQLL